MFIVKLKTKGFCIHFDLLVPITTVDDNLKPTLTEMVRVGKGFLNPQHVVINSYTPLTDPLVTGFEIIELLSTFSWYIVKTPFILLLKPFSS